MVLLGSLLYHHLHFFFNIFKLFDSIHSSLWSHSDNNNFFGCMRVCVFLVGGFCSPSFCAFPVIKKFIFFTIRFHVVQLMIKVIQASHICHIPLWGLLQS